MPLLSICIPTYNRSERICGLVNTILTSPGDYEICVHIDGATDDTLVKLQEVTDPRLKLSSGPNQGRGGAMLSALRQASGTYVMKYDDDDVLFNHGLMRVLEDIAKPLPENVAGLIYLMEDGKGEIIGTRFPFPRSNFIRLRADEGVTGDKKEVVRRDLLLSASPRFTHTYRRIPSSLYWSQIARTHDVLCVNEAVGEKDYLEGGMTAGMSKTKVKNAGPMVVLHRTLIRAYFEGRYKSVGYMLRSVMALLRYSAAHIRNRLRARFAITSRA